MSYCSAAQVPEKGLKPPFPELDFVPLWEFFLPKPLPRLGLIAVPPRSEAVMFFNNGFKAVSIFFVLRVGGAQHLLLFLAV